MAFIRAYAEQGDPFRFRLPRFIRPPKKLRSIVGKVARVAKRVAPIAGFALPGVGQVAALSRFAKVGRLARGAMRARRLVSRAQRLARLVQSHPDPEVQQA